MRPSFFKPVIGLERGLTDPIVELNMGQTAEILAHEFGISRRDADEYAAESQHRLVHAHKEKYFEGELEPAFGRDGRLFDYDDGERPDSTAESLAKLRPAFERPWGKVTAGNSSQITDGASWVILASEEAVKKYDLKPRAQIIDSAWGALDPSIMGLGPVLSSTKLMRRHNLALDAIELWEINEAFAAQVLACVAAWNDDAFCRDVLGPARCGRRNSARQAQRRRRRHRARSSGWRKRQPHRAASRQRHEAARQETRDRHGMHRRRPGRRDADRDGAVMVTPLQLLKPRDLELGPLSGLIASDAGTGD